MPYDSKKALQSLSKAMEDLHGDEMKFQALMLAARAKKETISNTIKILGNLDSLQDNGHAELQEIPEILPAETSIEQATTCGPGGARKRTKDQVRFEKIIIKMLVKRYGEGREYTTEQMRKSTKSTLVTGQSIQSKIVGNIVNSLRRRGYLDGSTRSGFHLTERGNDKFTNQKKGAHSGKGK